MPRAFFFGYKRLTVRYALVQTYVVLTSLLDLDFIFIW